MKREELLAAATPLRTVAADAVRDAVRRMAVDAAFVLDDRALAALREAAASEKSPLGREILGEILENAHVAREERRPLCQDTGLAVVWVELGEEVCVRGSLVEAVNEGVRRAWAEGPFRGSVVRDPLVRTNTGDNAPAFVHVDLVPGKTLRLHFMAKGGGSENQSRLVMLRPADGRAGVVKAVVESVKNGVAFACPPVIVGVGLGGTADHAAWLAKRALFRDLGRASDDPDTAALEKEILGGINASGIGPMGLGGTTTALAVHVERAPCHIASLPVAVAVNCHSHRVRSVEL